MKKIKTMEWKNTKTKPKKSFLFVRNLDLFIEMHKIYIGIDTQ